MKIEAQCITNIHSTLKYAAIRDLRRNIPRDLAEGIKDFLNPKVPVNKYKLDYQQRLAEFRKAFFELRIDEKGILVGRFLREMKVDNVKYAAEFLLDSLAVLGAEDRINKTAEEEKVKEGDLGNWEVLLPKFFRKQKISFADEIIFIVNAVKSLKKDLSFTADLIAEISFSKKDKITYAAKLVRGIFIIKKYSESQKNYLLSKIASQLRALEIAKELRAHDPNGKSAREILSKLKDEPPDTDLKEISDILSEEDS